MRILQVFLLPIILASCGVKGRQEITIAGSTSMEPFVEMLAEEFMSRNPEIRVLVQGGGSGAGVHAVRGGAAAIGMVSRALHKEEGNLHSLVIARDGIAVIVHRSNPVSELTTLQIRGVFSGRIKDWGALGGRKGPIWPVTREEGSGTRGAFQGLLMGTETITPQALVQDSNGSVHELIANDPNGIGYISVGVLSESVRAVSVDGVRPTRDNIKDGTYVFTRPFLFVMKTEPQGAVKQFVDFVLSGIGQRLLEDEGLIRAG